MPLVKAGKQALSRLQRKLRKHSGAYVAVDVDSGEWLVGPTVTDLLKEVESRMPGRRIYLSRVGEDHVFQIRRIRAL